MKNHHYFADSEDVLKVIASVDGVVSFVDEFSLNYRKMTLVDYEGGRHDVTLPGIGLVMMSNSFFDWADPETGLRGIDEPPQSEKVLRLWSDDLLTVSHDGAWVLLVNGTLPFGQEWIDVLFPPDDADYVPAVCFVEVYPDQVPPAGIRSLESAALTPNAIVNIEDCRSLLHP